MDGKIPAKKQDDSVSFHQNGLLFKKDKTILFTDEDDIYQPQEPDLRDSQTTQLGEDSPIQSFYKDETIFITGASGFLGTLLVEKLLRCCPNLHKLILLFRAGKNASVTNRNNSVTDQNTSVSERVRDYFSDQIFDRMRLSNPDYASKVDIICGSLDATDYGLCPRDVDALVANTSVIFHVAATVRFDEHIRSAYDINVAGTATTIALAKRMPRLKSFVYVSTAYCHCDRRHISESFYPPVFTASEMKILIDSASNEELALLNEHIIEDKPNTYTLTKATAEDLVRESMQELPVCVFRPSIVFPTLEEPMPLWMKGFNAILAVCLVEGMGLLRVALAKNNITIDIVPADRCTNAMVAVGWYHTTLDQSPSSDQTSLNDVKHTTLNTEPQVERSTPNHNRRSEQTSLDTGPSIQQTTLHAHQSSQATLNSDPHSKNTLNSDSYSEQFINNDDRSSETTFKTDSHLEKNTLSSVPNSQQTSFNSHSHSKTTLNSDLSSERFILKTDPSSETTFKTDSHSKTIFKTDQHSQPSLRTEPPSDTTLQQEQTTLNTDTLGNTTLKPTQPHSKVFNFISSQDNRVVTIEMVDAINKAWSEAQESGPKVLWKSGYCLTDSFQMYIILFYVLHAIPAVVFSLGERLKGRRPQVMRTYRKIFHLTKVIVHFILHEWKFDNANMQALDTHMSPLDRHRFDTSMRTFHWESMFGGGLHRAISIYLLGIRPSKAYYNKKMVYIERLDYCMRLMIKGVTLYVILSVAARLINAHFVF